MSKSDKQETVRVPCAKCGGNTPHHAVLREYDDNWGCDKAQIYGTTSYQTLKCQGCESIRFRISETCSEDRDCETGEYEVFEKGLFPNESLSHRLPVDDRHFPDDVSKIYQETIACFNAGALTLAGGGLRATVEAICIDRGVTNQNLQQKVDALVTQGYLASGQADLLHEERYLGNYALHEMRTPSKSDLEDGLKIIEGVMETIYVLPIRAERLRRRRTGDDG